MQVIVRGPGVHPVAASPGERVFLGREPHGAVGDLSRPDVVALRLPNCAAHVSAVAAELVVGHEAAWLHWHGRNEGRLSSLFAAPGGARRVTLIDAMTATLDEGKNELSLLAGRQLGDTVADLELVFLVDGAHDAPAPERPAAGHTERKPHERDHRLPPHSKEWFVALALAEPWLAGDDDSPFPPTNRRIYERIRHWRGGDAWNLERSQRVDDVIRTVARLAFGERNDPYAAERDGRIQNPRYVVGKRVAEFRLVTSQDLDAVEQAVRHGRNVPGTDS